MIKIIPAENFMDDNKTIRLLLEKLQIDFALQNSLLPAACDLTLIKKYLEKVITEMMDKDYKKFLNTLYRIDISEEKVSRVFAVEKNENIPGSLADLIIERQLLRVKTQLLYKNGKL